MKFSFTGGREHNERRGPWIKHQSNLIFRFLGRQKKDKSKGDWPEAPSGVQEKLRECVAWKQGKECIWKWLVKSNNAVIGKHATNVSS